MKIIDGQLEENIYDKKLNLLQINKCKKNSISYIEKNIKLHKIINSNNKTISLHIYSPPNHITKIYK
jgi:hypothetical protein